MQPFCACSSAFPRPRQKLEKLHQNLFYFLSASQVFHLCQPKIGLGSCPALKDAFLFACSVLFDGNFHLAYTTTDEITRLKIIPRELEPKGSKFALKIYKQKEYLSSS